MGGGNWATDPDVRAEGDRAVQPDGRVRQRPSRASPRDRDRSHRPAPESQREHDPRIVTDVPSRVDRWFNRVTLAAGLTVLVLLMLVGIFLLLRSRQALSETGVLDFLTREEWRTDVQPAAHRRARVCSPGTVLVALIAVVDRGAVRDHGRAVHHRVRVARSCGAT